nr:hypothetical protein [Tanacetum cinerariifolium]
LPLLRLELHGLVPARPAGRADRHRPSPHHATTRPDGRHPDPGGRIPAVFDGHARRSAVTQDGRHHRPDHRHRCPALRLATGHSQL